MVEPNTLWVSLKLVLSIQMFTLKPGYKSIVSEVMKFVETPTSYGGIPPEWLEFGKKIEFILSSWNA